MNFTMGLYGGNKGTNTYSKNEKGTQTEDYYESGSVVTSSGPSVSMRTTTFNASFTHKSDTVDDKHAKDNITSSASYSYSDANGASENIDHGSSSATTTFSVSSTYLAQGNISFIPGTSSTSGTWRTVASTFNHYEQQKENKSINHLFDRSESFSVSGTPMYNKTYSPPVRTSPIKAPITTRASRKLARSYGNTRTPEKGEEAICRAVAMPSSARRICAQRPPHITILAPAVETQLEWAVPRVTVPAV